MACMEHHCSRCGWYGWDNEVYRKCPICKANEVTNWFDEPESDDNEEQYEK